MSPIHETSKSPADKAGDQQNGISIVREKISTTDSRSNSDNKELLETPFRLLKACRADASFRRRDDLDQCPATIETTIRRLNLLINMGLLENRRVLLLGDDDLLSIGIVAAGFNTGVTVIDLDRRLLSQIAQWTKNSCETLHHDLRHELPAKVTGNYDVVFTDPPYTLAGQYLFLHAAVKAIRNLESSSLFLCASRFYLGQPQIKSIVAAVENAGLSLCGVEENFNEYEPPPDVAADLRKRSLEPQSPFLYSTIFHFKPCSQVIKPELVPFHPDRIYEYEENEAS